MDLIVKKVLFVTYYWPPSGKASLHWPIRMIQHLPGFGWQPCVLTAAEDTFSQKDESLVSAVNPSLHVFKVRSFEPFSLYRSFLGKKEDEPLVASETISRSDRGMRHRLAIWIRMNLFVPDARIGWYWNAVRQGRKALQRENIDCVVSIGPPHTSLLVGKKIAKVLGVPHVPVFIDPWVDIAYYRGFKRSGLTSALDRRLERSVLQQSGSVVFVTRSMKEDYGARYPFLRDKSHVLYWGYDEDAFRNFDSASERDAEVVLHAGNIFDFQNPKPFWKILRSEIDRGRKLRIVFVGTVSPGVRQSIEEAGLKQATSYKGFLTYDEMIRELGKASYLLVCASEKRHVPGKLFEYLRAGKPIIAFGDDNREIEGMLKDSDAGILLRYQYSGTDIFQRLEALHPNSTACKQYDRKVVAGELGRILGSLS